MLSLRVALKTAKHVELELFVTLRVVDRVALTARQTLTDRLGYGNILVDLKRRDYYRVAIAGDEAAALAYLHEIAESTTEFANPNKETFSVQPVERPLSKESSYVALVYPREGLFDEAFCRHLSLELGYDGVVAAGRGVAWTIELAPGADPKYVEDILVARERSRGLLANPHGENYEIV